MNYQMIYDNFRQAAEYEEEAEQPFFAPSTQEKMEVLTELYRVCASCSAIWTEKDIAPLRDLKIPDPLLAFYREMEPINAPMNEAGLYLADLDRIRQEYSQLEPGCYLIKFGLLVIAATIGGNPILVDLYDENAPVFICDYQLLSCDKKDGQVNLSFPFPSQVLQDRYGAEVIPVNRNTLLECLTPIEKSFEEFITKLSADEYECDLEDLLD